MVLNDHKVKRLLGMLVAATIVCVLLVVARFVYVWSPRFRFCGLLFNLFLAWIPMALSLLLWWVSPTRRIVLLFLFVAWILFFPNTFYIITDLIHDHKFGMDGVSRWYDILMTACFAVTGMFLGSYSLCVLHTIVRSNFGRAVGWFFAGAVLAVGAYGTYLGRVLRLNSWDAFLRPWSLIARAVTGPSSAAEVMLFCLGFFIFTSLVYSFVVYSTEFHNAPLHHSRPQQ
jgi:uncharacterized membrane protein